MDLQFGGFKGITLLITQYNRSNSLERLLNALDCFGFDFGEVIVSDDASSDGHLERVHALRDKIFLQIGHCGANKGLAYRIGIRVPLLFLNKKVSPYGLVY